MAKAAKTPSQARATRKGGMVSARAVVADKTVFANLRAGALTRGPGTNARNIHRFLSTLDAKLGATPAQILDATREPQFTL